MYWYDVDLASLIFNGTYSTNTWYYIVMAQSGTSISAYKNGDFIQTQTGGNIGNSYNNKSIGSYLTLSRYWNGRIALIQIYNKQLSSTEISQNYNALKSRFGL